MTSDHGYELDDYQTGYVMGTQAIIVQHKQRFP